MTIILHDKKIHVAYLGPYPWIDGAVEKAQSGEDGWSIITAPDAEYYEGDAAIDWDFTTGTRLVQRVIPEPVLTEAQQITNEMATLSAYLESTDWYAVRLAETGEEPPLEVSNKRQEARNRISEIRELLKTEE